MHPVEALFVPLGRRFHDHRADETASLSHRPELTTDRRFAVSSPRFAEGGEIPARHCGPLIGANVSPALEWSGLPAATAELLMIMEDLDSPGRDPRLHAIAVFAPEAGDLADGDLNRGSTRSRFVRGTRGPLAYRGPRPLPGHGPHRYRLHLFALDRRRGDEELGSVERMLAAVDGHVLASGVLVGIRES